MNKTILNDSIGFGVCNAFVYTVICWVYWMATSQGFPTDSVTYSSILIGTTTGYALGQIRAQCGMTYQKLIDIARREADAKKRAAQ